MATEETNTTAKDNITAYNIGNTSISRVHIASPSKHQFEGQTDTKTMLCSNTVKLNREDTSSGVNSTAHNNSNNSNSSLSIPHEVHTSRNNSNPSSHINESNTPSGTVPTSTPSMTQHNLSSSSSSTAASSSSLPLSNNATHVMDSTPSDGNSLSSLEVQTSGRSSVNETPGTPETIDHTAYEIAMMNHWQAVCYLF